MRYFCFVHCVEERGEVDGKEVSHCGSVPRRNRTGAFSTYRDGALHLAPCFMAPGLEAIGVQPTIFFYLFLREALPRKMPR